MRGLATLVPVLAAVAIVFGQPATAPTPAKADDVHKIADISSERLVVFESFLRPG